jgi:hypothetical protein
MRMLLRREKASAALYDQRVHQLLPRARQTDHLEPHNEPEEMNGLGRLLEERTVRGSVCGQRPKRAQIRSETGQGKCCSGLDASSHIDRALTAGATRLDGDGARLLGGIAHVPAARFDFATTPSYRQRVRPVSWGQTRRSSDKRSPQPPASCGRGSTSTVKWITAFAFSRWADTTRTALSELVSALIRATASDIRSFRFPAGDSAQIPGYDGRLSARGVEPYVADGESVWEFGVGTQYLDKANEDFQRRTNAPGDIVRSGRTFVLVTPRT